MKLSEAVAIGLPEIRFTWTQWLWLPDGPDGECTGCLAGAALWACGRREDVSDRTETKILAEHWPWVRGWKFIGPLPCCGQNAEDSTYGNRIGGFLTHLAKHYANQQLTAERILEIIRSIEPADLPKPAPAPPAEQHAEAETVPGPISTLREETKAAHVHHERAVTKLLHVPSPITCTE